MKAVMSQGNRAMPRIISGSFGNIFALAQKCPLFIYGLKSV